MQMFALIGDMNHSVKTESNIMSGA
jgi:hypothetical protein